MNDFFVQKTKINLKVADDVCIHFQSQKKTSQQYQRGYPFSHLQSFGRQL